MKILRLLWLLGLAAGGAEYFIAPAPTGNDSNPGTLVSPKATATNAIRTYGGGNTYTLLPGEHKYIYLTSTADGGPSAANPTIIRSQTNWTASITNVQTSFDGYLVAESGVVVPHVRLEGLKLHNAGHDAVKARCYWQVINCWVKNAEQQGIALNSSPGAGTNIVMYNLVETNGLAGAGCHGMYISGGSNYIAHNVFRGNGDSGFQLYSAFSDESMKLDNNIVLGNLVYGNDVVDVYFYGGLDQGGAGTTGLFTNTTNYAYFNLSGRWNASWGKLQKYRNNIILTNAAGIGLQPHATRTPIIDIDYCLTDQTGGFGLGGANNVTDVPTFVNRPQALFWPAADSPALNVGDGTYVPARDWFNNPVTSVDYIGPWGLLSQVFLDDDRDLQNNTTNPNFWELLAQGSAEFNGVVTVQRAYLPGSSP